MYRTYLVNESSEFTEYEIFSKEEGVFTHSGILPPKWACFSREGKWERETAGESPWVLPLDIALGQYQIRVRFRYDYYGAEEPGGWQVYDRELGKGQYEKEGLIPYWEIEDLDEDELDKLEDVAPAEKSEELEI